MAVRPIVPAVGRFCWSRHDRVCGRVARQVLERYVEYADAVLGRFGVRPDGSGTPNVRTVSRPLLNLFVGEPGGRKWRHLLDAALLKKPATVSQVVQARPIISAPPPTRML